MACQTDLSGDDVIQMKQLLKNSQEEVAKLRQTVQAVQDDLTKRTLTREAVEKDNHLLKFYTGKHEAMHAYIQMFINIYSYP